MLNENNRSGLISPYGEKLIDLMAPEEDRSSLRIQANELPSILLSERSLCDLELLATGGFSPLDGFMGADDHQRVLDDMRLTSGVVFPLPITLPVDPTDGVRPGQSVALRDSKNDLLAILEVEEIYDWDLKEVAKKAYGTTDSRHPIVAEMHSWPKQNVSGKLTVLQLPARHDFGSLRMSPSQTRHRLDEMGHGNVVAFQTRNPMHRVHEELTKRAAREIDGTLLIHPVVGMTKPGDVDHITRVRTYKALTERYYEPDRVLLSLLPLAMRMGGPREALWHAIIRRNFGANHLIVGRDHAGPGNDSQGKPFYGPYDAQDMLREYDKEIGVAAVPFKEIAYLPDEDRYEEMSQVPADAHTVSLSGTQVREEYLLVGKALPEWFTRPEVAEIMAETYPPRHRQGMCVWFTGLSGSGKSTTAEVLTTLLMEHGRQVTLLDGDTVRTHLSKGLGFSKEDRDINIRRIGYVAAEIVRHGGIAVCAAISPYRATRDELRSMMGADRFLEVFVDTPIEVCEGRDTKGMYAKARRGEIKDFTGVDDVYEVPDSPEFVLNTVTSSADQNAREIFAHLLQADYVRAELATATA